MNMEFPFEVLRGWPNDGASDSVEQISTTATGASALSAGDVVALQSDGTVALSGSAASNTVGFIVRGNGDSKSAIAAGSKATVIWGNFIARTQKYNTAGTYAPGTNLTAKLGKLDVAAAGDPVIGFVKEVVPAVGSEPANIVVVVR